MDIGEERETIIIEPLESPAPDDPKREPAPEPARAPEPERKPEPVPA